MFSLSVLCGGWPFGGAGVPWGREVPPATQSAAAKLARGHALSSDRITCSRLILTESDKGCCLQYLAEGESIAIKAVDAPVDCEATCYLYISRSASRKDTAIRVNNAIDVDKSNITVNNSKSINRNSTAEKDQINSYVNVLFDFCDYIKKKVYNKWKNTLLNFKRLSVPKGSSRKWNLRSVSLFRRNSIVVCELMWLPQMALALYHVTWEVEGEWVKGHTFTDVARVKLSLGPDTKYKVTVRLLLSARLESESLIIDTGKVSDGAEGVDAITYSKNNAISIVMLDVYNRQTVTLFSFMPILCMIVLLFMFIRLKLGRVGVRRSVIIHL